MSFSRRHFMKAAGAGAVAVTTTVVAGVDQTTAAPKPSPLAIPEPMTKETAIFNVDGKNYKADYEARTTLWEVIAVKLGLTGTNRSCNRASCGACSVLIDGTPFYSCHTLATEAVGKKIFTVEGLGDANNLHPLQRVAHLCSAAECGFCTPGWEVTAKALLDKNPNPTVEQVKAALAGHICRCAAYTAIERTVIDTGKVMRGEAEIA
jgi:aerobic-type carbon monoxide dehydrogenase small subunit (CoxS/CutS family)